MSLRIDISALSSTSVSNIGIDYTGLDLRIDAEPGYQRWLGSGLYENSRWKRCAEGTTVLVLALAGGVAGWYTQSSSVV
jgi:hypothetical protein